MKLIRYKEDPVNKGVVLFLCFLMVFPFQLVADVSSGSGKTDEESILTPTGVPVSEEEIKDDFVVKGDSLMITKRDTIPFIVPPDSIAMMNVPADSLGGDGQPLKVFNPDPNRAVWLSALFPGLGQIYNRRYWKVPIVVGGFMGITYAMSWNGRMLTDYTKAYRDATDNDPNTKSYLKFYNSNIKEEDINMDLLRKTLKSKKDYFRRNRDLSIICMVGLYLLCMVDAYVDASLAHFDISPDLSMNVYPALIEPNRNGLPSFGVQWAFNF